MRFSLYRATDAVRAHAVALEIVRDFVSGARSFDALPLQSAKSAVVFEVLAEAGASLAEAAAAAQQTHGVCGVRLSHTQRLLSAVQRVSGDELRASVAAVARVLEAPQSTCAVAAAPAVRERRVKGVQARGGVCFWR